MAQPTPYNVSKSFAQDEANSLAGRGTVSTSGVDTELANIETTLDEILANLTLIQRDDGDIANQSIGMDQLKAEVSAGINASSDWLTATLQPLRSAAWNDGALYYCLVEHTSGIFADDLAANKWLLLVDFSIYVTSASDSATAAEASRQAADADAIQTGYDAAAAAISAAAALASTPQYVATSKAGLAGLELTSADAGKKVFVTSVGDGGSFTVRYNAVLGTYADNSPQAMGTIAIPAGGDGTIGVERDYDCAINVKWFGAKGDGVTSDIAAITFAKAQSNILTLPRGVYLFDVDSTSLFDDETLLIFEDGAILKAASGVQVRGNSCAIEGNLTQHFDHPNYDTQWATATVYTAGDIRQFEYGRYYIATVDHTSGVWWNGSTGDKDTNKFIPFAPFQFFQRKERDFFIYPEWFGAKADGTTLSSIPFTKSLSCNSVMASISLVDSSGTTINGYYKLNRPFVILNGRTLYGGETDRAPALLRLDGATWTGGDLGVSSEEIPNAPANLNGYSSLKNVRFQIENFNNVNFQWVKMFFLETTKAEQITWEFIGSNTIKQEAHFSGGPVNICDINMVYGDGGIVEDHPLFLDLYNGATARNINYKNKLAKKGLKIRAGRFTDITGVFIENGPTAVSEAYLNIEQTGDSNGRIGEIFITNDKAGDTTGLALEVISNTGLNSHVSNVNIENIKIFPHDGVGSALDNIVKINGTTWTRAQLQDSTGNTNISIAKINQNDFLLAGTASQHSNGPARSSWHFPTIANAGIESIHFAPILRQGVAADTYSAWCGIIMIAARGTTDLSYCAFVGLQQDEAGAFNATITELSGPANFSVAWNAATSKWDITNTSGEGVNQVIISFINQGPNIFTQ